MMTLNNGKLEISQYRMNQLKRLEQADQKKVMHAIGCLIKASGPQLSASDFDNLLSPARELAATPCVSGSDRSRSFLWVGSLAKEVNKQKEDYMFMLD